LGKKNQLRIRCGSLPGNAITPLYTFHNSLLLYFYRRGNCLGGARTVCYARANYAYIFGARASRFFDTNMKAISWMDYDNRQLQLKSSKINSQMLICAMDLIGPARFAIGRRHGQKRRKAGRESPPLLRNLNLDCTHILRPLIKLLADHAQRRWLHLLDHGAHRAYNILT